jgi:hypothetical protein
VRGTIPHVNPPIVTAHIDVWKHAQDGHGEEIPCAAK